MLAMHAPCHRRWHCRPADPRRRALLDGRPRGMTLIEVMFAIVILSGVMLSLARFGQGFTRASRNAANLAIASDLAAARIEIVKTYPDYAGIVATFNGDVESSGDATANPSMAGNDGYTRTTQAVRVMTDSTDLVTVTVTVTADVLIRPVAKTVLIARLP